MNLYQLHDDAQGLCSHDEDRNWLAVWARCPSEAERLFMDRHDCDRDSVHWEEVERVAEPAKTVPHVEYRPHVLRRLGWHVESEHSCNTCGLYPMALPEFALCPDCEACGECCTCADEPIVLEENP